MLILDTDLQLFLGKMFNLHPGGTKDGAERLGESGMRYFEQKKTVLLITLWLLLCLLAFDRTLIQSDVTL